MRMRDSGRRPRGIGAGLIGGLLLSAAGPAHGQPAESAWTPITEERLLNPVTS